MWNDEVKTLHNEHKKLQGRINDLQEHKHKATDRLVAGDITKLEKAEIHQRANNEIDSLQSELNRLDGQVGTKQEAIDYALNYMDNASQLWKDATPEMKLVYQSMIFPEGLTYNFYDKIFRTPVLSPLYFSHNTKTTLPMKAESLVVISRRIELRLPG